MIHALEGLRGVAALLVAFYHLHLMRAGPLAGGYLMVDLFFVLSGYILFRTYADKLDRPAALAPFVTRRAGRLLPLYLFATLLTFLAFALADAGRAALAGAGLEPAAGSFYLPSLADVVANLTLTHFLTLAGARVIDWPSWSIGTEFYVYLLFALVCVRVPRRGLALAAGLLAATAAGAFAWLRVGQGCVVTGQCLNAYQDLGFLRCVAGFFYGGLLWLLTRRPNPRRDALLTRAQLPLLALLLGLLALASTHAGAEFALPPLFGLLVLTLATDRGVLARCLQRPAAQTLGRLSYSIYLVHAPLAVGVEFALAHAGAARPALLPLALAGYGAALLGLAARTQAEIEVPGRDYFNALARRLGRADDAATPAATGAKVSQAPHSRHAL